MEGFAGVRAQQIVKVKIICLTPSRRRRHDGCRVSKQAGACGWALNDLGQAGACGWALNDSG
jgi:hypothetical protein